MEEDHKIEKIKKFSTAIGTKKFPSRILISMQPANLIFY